MLHIVCIQRISGKCLSQISCCPFCATSVFLCIRAEWAAGAQLAWAGFIVFGISIFTFNSLHQKIHQGQQQARIPFFFHDKQQENEDNGTVTVLEQRLKDIRYPVRGLFCSLFRIFLLFWPLRFFVCPVCICAAAILPPPGSIPSLGAIFRRWASSRCVPVSIFPSWWNRVGGGRMLGGSVALRASAIARIV